MYLSRVRAFWILAILILAGILCMSGADTLVDEVCYEANFPRECSQHELQCLEGKLAIDDAFRGFKDPLPCLYPSKRTNCTGADLCCQHTPGDCLVTFSSQALADLTRLCQNQTNCTFVPPYRERKQECNDSFEPISSYSRILYHCTQDDVTSASFTTSSTGLTSSGTEAGVIGGIVGAAVLVVLAVVGIYRFRRRPFLAKSCSKTRADLQANKDGGSPGPGGARTQASPGPTSDSSDYDLLGHKRPHPSPHDVTYGHLNLSGDVTEGDYDHVRRDGKAEVSREVVDNVYSRAGPPGATSSFDDSVHYDVSGAVTKQRRDVIDSPYDVASK